MLEYLLSNLTTIKNDELHDLRKCLSKQAKLLESCIKNVNAINDEIYDILRLIEIERLKRSVVKIGVYEIRKSNKRKLIYHIVSDNDYEFQANINISWYLVNSYELELNKPLNINRFIIDIDYWLLTNAY